MEVYTGEFNNIQLKTYTTNPRNTSPTIEEVRSLSNVLYQARIFLILKTYHDITKRKERELQTNILWVYIDKIP